MRILIILLLTATMLTVNNCTNIIAGKKVANIPVDMKIYLINDKDSVHIFAYIESEKMEDGDNSFLDSIVNIKGQLIHNGSNKSYEILFSKQQTRAWKTAESQYITFVVAGKVLGTNGIGLEDYSIKILLETNNIYIFEKPCSKIFGEQHYLTDVGLIVVPYYEQAEGNSAVFGLFAYRIRQIEEYLPSSEDLRVEVFSRKGKKVFSSSKGGAFLTVVKEVYPKQVGNMYEYSYPWLGKSDSGSILLNGDYSAKVFIPVMPKPYGRIINFYWENNE